jgi:hypothetical protein
MSLHIDIRPRPVHERRSCDEERHEEENGKHCSHTLKTTASHLWLTLLSRLTYSYKPTKSISTSKATNVTSELNCIVRIYKWDISTRSFPENAFVASLPFLVSVSQLFQPGQGRKAHLQRHRRWWDAVNIAYYRMMFPFEGTLIVILRYSTWAGKTLGYVSSSSNISVGGRLPVFNPTRRPKRL